MALIAIRTRLEQVMVQVLWWLREELIHLVSIIYTCLYKYNHNIIVIMLLVFCTDEKGNSSATIAAAVVIPIVVVTVIVVVSIVVFIWIFYFRHKEYTSNGK